MKQFDISADVMKNVASFEKQRSRIWFNRFILCVSIICAGLSVVLVGIIRQLLEQRTFDVLELFTQDPDIIREFWIDVLTIFWDELPRSLMIIGAGIITALIIVLLYTRRKRIIMKKKLSQLDKYV